MDKVKEKEWGLWGGDSAGLVGRGRGGSKDIWGLTIKMIPRTWPETGVRWMGPGDQLRWESKVSQEMQPWASFGLFLFFNLIPKNVCCV